MGRGERGVGRRGVSDGLHPDVDDGGGDDDRARGIEDASDDVHHVADRGATSEPQGGVAERFELGGQLAVPRRLLGAQPGAEDSERTQFDAVQRPVPWSTTAGR
jgi:hypothetical protein